VTVQAGGARLRKAEAADADKLAAVFIAAWRHAYPGIVPEERLERLEDKRITTWLSALVASPLTGTVVAECDEDQIVGFCRFGPDPEEASAGHVFSLYVSPGASHHGIGGSLLLRALEELEQRHLGRVTLWVFEENKVARRFYSRFGFVPDGQRRVEPDYGAEEIRLCRPAQISP
jgi:ribosomal protein S18 acetylase RimI-like enzyme